MGKGRATYVLALKNIGGKSFGLAIAVVLIVSSPGQAIWLGQSQVNPYLEIQEQYESNVFRASTSGQVENVLVTVISPGLHVEFPTAKDSAYRFLANYRANLNFYNKHGDAQVDPDSQLNSTEHRFDAQARLNFASGVNFMTGYILNLGSVAPHFLRDTRDKYTEHEIQAQTGYKFTDAYELQVSYDGIFRRFDKETVIVDGVPVKDDLNTQSLDATVSYRLFPSLSVLGGGGYTAVTRKAFSDSNEYRGFGGIRYEATARLIGLVKAGMVRKKIIDEDSANTDIFALGELTADFSEDTKLLLAANRNIGDTSTVNNSANNGTYYIVTGARATLTHKFASLPKLSSSALLGYQRKTYPDDIADREDNILEAGLGAEYKFLKYVILGLNYSYNNTDSSLDSYDFNDSIVILSVSAKL